MYWGYPMKISHDADNTIFFRLKVSANRKRLNLKILSHYFAIITICQIFYFNIFMNFQLLVFSIWVTSPVHS